ncbi:hypothetical protein vBAbaMD22_127 [Acinetobacter phage vB_AbaM_D22]|nr:hypothetical protein vBAbaMD22_127 [Acinetobacter phage vB_AbaM_D22]
MSKCREIVEYFGGTVEAFKALMSMHRIGFSRKYEMENGNLIISDIHGDSGHFPSELELALEETLAQDVLLRHKPQSVEYVDAETYPEVYYDNTRLDGFTTFSKSPPLILKTHHRGEDRYVTGYMIKYHDERPNVYHLDGHNGDWHSTVKGWAYC